MRGKKLSPFNFRNLLEIRQRQEKKKEKKRNKMTKGWTFATLLFKIKFTSCSLLFHHHHPVTPSARISLTLSRHLYHHFRQILRARSRIYTELLYVSSSGHPAFPRPSEGVHKSTLLVSSSLHLQQCPACLVRLILIVFVISGRWPYSYCFVGCCLQDLFNIARSILV